MNAELKAKWLEALRSGRIEQGQHILRTERGAMCCIGVLAHIQGVELEKMDVEDLRTSKLMKPYDAGLAEAQMCDLAQMNDRGSSFAEIADYIEANL